MKPQGISKGVFILSLLFYNMAFGQWQASSNGIQSNVVYCLVEALDGSIIAGTGNGIFRSQDSGDTWTISSDGLIAGDSTILRAGSKDGRLFVGTTENLYYSDNNGGSWELSQSFGSRIFGICESQGDVFVGTLNDGVHRSNNNGASWIGANSGIITDSIFSIYASDSYIFAGTYGHGIFRSNDQGLNWTQVLSDNDPLQVKRITSTATKVFAAGTIMVNSTAPFYTPFHSNNDGQSWSVYYSPDLPSPGNFYVSAMHGTGNSVLFAGGGNIYLSTDNGSSWSVFMDGFTATPSFGVGCFLETDSYIFCGLEGGGLNHCFRVPKNQVTTGLNSLEVDAVLNIFPNPTDGTQLTLDYHLDRNLSHEWLIYDVAGRLTFETQLINSEGQIAIPKTLEPGTYLSVIRNRHGLVRTESLVVAK